MTGAPSPTAAAMTSSAPPSRNLPRTQHWHVHTAQAARQQRTDSDPRRRQQRQPSAAAESGRNSDQHQPTESYGYPGDLGETEHRPTRAKSPAAGSAFARTDATPVVTRLCWQPPPRTRPSRSSTRARRSDPRPQSYRLGSSGAMAKHQGQPARNAVDDSSWWPLIPQPSSTEHDPQAPAITITTAVPYRPQCPIVGAANMSHRLPHHRATAHQAAHPVTEHMHGVHGIDSFSLSGPPCLVPTGHGLVMLSILSRRYLSQIGTFGGRNEVLRRRRHDFVPFRCPVHQSRVEVVPRDRGMP